VRNQLQRAVIALAQPADIQLSLFPDFVRKADELALDFEDGLYEMVGHEGQFSEQQRGTIDVLNALISSKMGEQHAAFWNETAVRDHPLWDTNSGQRRRCHVRLGLAERPFFRSGLCSCLPERQLTFPFRPSAIAQLRRSILGRLRHKTDLFETATLSEIDCVPNASVRRFYASRD
jgi:hypothetical protein